jgi:hypothetical protein
LPCSYGLAHTIYLDALDGWRESLGHCHPNFATLLGQLAFVTMHLGRNEEAESYYRYAGFRVWVLSV